MASTISDFSKRVKKMAPDVGLATNYDGEKEYNAVRSNPFRRSVTLNNSGKPARTGWLVHIKLDTKAIYALNQCAFTFSDLRVYDSDQTTELQFYVEAPNTAWTSIFVRVDLPAGGSKTIWLYYGNPGLESKSDISTLLIFGSSNILTSWRCRYWGKGNQPTRVFNGELTGPVFYCENHKGGPKFDFFNSDINPTSTGTVPSYTLNSVNGLPEMTFDGDNDFLSQATYPSESIIRTNVSYHIFAVAARADTGTNYILAGDVTSPGTNQLLHFGWRDNTTFTLGQWGNNLNATVSGYSSKTWQLCEGEKLGGVGTRLYINGSLVGSNTNTAGLSVDNILRIGYQEQGSIYYNGGIADILMFQVPFTGLSSNEINNVRTYLRVKYALYNTSSDPTVTVNSQQASGSTEWSYTSYAPFCEFRENIKAEVGAYPESTGTVKITNLMQKTLAVGNSVETWSNSTVDKTGKYISAHECRTRTATTSAGVDSVTIERLDGSNNRGDLGKFEVENIVEATTYSSTDDDYIEFELWPTNAATISTTNSYIRFENSGNTLSYQAALSKNENLLSSGILNTVRIKKTEFTRFGSGTWTTASYRCKINIQTSSGSQAVYYGNVRLVRRFDTAPEVDYNNPIRLRNGVSSDNDATYYLTTMQTGRITDRKIKNNEFEMDTQDYLKLIQRRKFSDFDSFPGRFAVMTGSGDVKKWYTDFLIKILGFAFPNSLLDIDLDLPASTPSPYGFSASNAGLLWAYGFEIFGEKIEKILKACGGMLWYEPATGKITARSGNKIWDSTGSLGTAYNIVNIIDYKEADTNQSPIFNAIPPTPTLYSFYNGALGIPPSMITIGTGGGLATLRANEESPVFLPFDRLKGQAYSILPLNTLVIGGWNFYNATGSGFDNSGITITGIDIVADNAVVIFRNSNNFDKTLASITFSVSGFLWFRPVFTVTLDGRQSVLPPAASETTAENQTSISRRGRQEYEVDPIYAYMSDDVDLDSTPVTSFVPPLINIPTVLANSTLVQAEVAYDPYLHPGKYVSIRNKESRLVYGYITALEHYSKGGEYRSVVTVREI